MAIDYTVLHEKRKTVYTVAFNTGPKGDQGEAGDLTSSWVFLATTWTEPPSINATTPTLGGFVYNYTDGLVTRFRHIPEPYDATQDTFYSTYSAGVLSNPIISRS